MKTISIVAILAATPVLAQDIALEDIVVTANRTETDATRTGTSVAVLTEDDLAQAGEATVGQVLATLPGVSLTSTGPFGNNANLRIRGADQRYIAVFVDGVRVSDPSGVQTSFDFGSLLAADVGRIEVLRGSQSALWGGSAVGGVVNIATRAAIEEGFRQKVALEAGSYGTKSLSYGLTQKTEKMETALTLTHLQTDGFSAVAGGTEADGGEATRLSFSTRYAVSDALVVGVSAFAQDTTQDYDGYDPTTFVLVDQNNVQDRREAGGRVFAELSAGNTEHVFEATQYQIGRDYDQEGSLSSFDGSRLTLGWQATTTVSDALTLVYGLDTMQEKARYSNLPAGVADTRLSGAFVQALWAPTDQLDVSATLRTDHNSTFGSFGTGRLALAWRPADSWTVRAAAATGYRAPSIDERFGDYPDPAFPFAGNPDLVPETSKSFELGVERAFANGASLSLTAFRLGVENLVTYTPCPSVDPSNFDFSCQPGTISTLQNLAGTSVRKGVEIGASIPVTDRITLGGSYTYTDAFGSTGQRLGLVARSELSLSLNAQVTDVLSMGLSVQHAAGRKDDFGAFDMPDYTVLGASVTYDLTDKAQAVLRVENLLDEDYQLTSGYAAAGRSVYAGLRASF